jgi:pyrimidine operon attenuation protein / uracil phosphoribosyltransferase
MPVLGRRSSVARLAARPEARESWSSATAGTLAAGSFNQVQRGQKGRFGVQEKTVLDREDVRRTLVRIAHEIVENTGGEGVAVVGIHRRGAVLGARLRDLVAELVGEPVPLGDIDISFYRDDVGIRGPDYQPVVHASHIDFPVEDTTIVLVDDVLYTGRTVRAAIDALFDYGRPRRVQLAVLADRGHRELPIRPDYVGKNLPTSREERVNVRVEELDGVDEVGIAEAQHA